MKPIKELMARSNLHAVEAIRLATRQEVIVAASAEDVNRLPTERKDKVLAKVYVCSWLESKQQLGVSLNNAIKTMLLTAELGNGADGQHHRAMLQCLATGGKALPTRSTILQWLVDYKAGGIAALMSGHWKRRRKTKGWEAKAVEIFNVPGKVSMAAVARDLRRKHGFDCSDEEVCNYLDSLSSHLGKHSAARLGEHFFKQTETPFVRRDTSSLLAGDIYMADGYRADVYLAHPLTGSIWRPEIMHVIDVKTGYLVGYRIMANEGGFDVMIGWAEIFARHDHVPPIVYVDRGSGYINLLASDEVSGYLKRSGVQTLTKALPKNARGKGNIERYHRVVRDDFLKTWMPQFYCGPDMAKDVLDVTTREVRAGRLALPTLAQFIDAYNDWLKDDYHQRSARDDKTRTRTQAFADLVQIKPHASAEEIARPCQKRVVQRAAVRLHNREYLHPDLIGWNHKPVLVEFDIFNHGSVTVRDMTGHLICDAPLVKTIGTVSDSILQDSRNKALADATARLEKKLLEQKMRAGHVIDVDAVVVGAMPAIETTVRVIDHDEDFLLDLTIEDNSPREDEDEE